MADVKWVKLTTDMFDNRKIKHLRKLPEGNNIVLIWVMLLTMAGRCNSGGLIFLTENIPYTPKMLADELDFEENTVIFALQVLEQLEMIVTDNGFFSIAGWEEYQNIDGMERIREQNRERQRLQRERRKQALLDESRDSHVTVTECHAIEEEEETDLKKEIHSFSLSSEDRERLKLKYIGGDLGKGVVMLSDEQFDILLDKLSWDEFHKYISIVAECELNGKRYKNKSHYQAILDMVEKDRGTI